MCLCLSVYVCGVCACLSACVSLCECLCLSVHVHHSRAASVVREFHERSGMEGVCLCLSVYVCVSVCECMRVPAGVCQLVVRVRWRWCPPSEKGEVLHHRGHRGWLHRSCTGMTVVMRGLLRCGW